MNTLSNSEPELTLTELLKVTKTEVNKLIEEKKYCDREIGKRLQTLKQAIVNKSNDSLKLEMNTKVFYEFTRENFSFDKSKTNTYLEMFDTFGTEPTFITERQMQTVVKAPQEKRAIVVEALTELAKTQPTVKVPIKKIQAAVGAVKGETKVELKELTGILAKENDYELLERNKTNYAQELAESIVHAAKMSWKADHSAQEIVDEIEKIRNNKTQQELDNLNQKLSRIWKLLHIG